MNSDFLRHQFLLNLGSLFADKDWDAEEHQALWDEFYPPKTNAQKHVIELTLMGKVVPERVIEKARTNDQNNTENL